MSDFSAGALPGLRPVEQSLENQVLWSARGGQTLAAARPVTLDASAADAGNTPATTLRAGRVLALADADGKARPYDPDATDGTQIAAGVLERSQNMLEAGAAVDRFVAMLVHGLLKESALLGLDPRAKAQLAARFVFDSDPGAAAGWLLTPRGVYRKTAHYNVAAADNGLLLLAAAAVTFTLPGKQNGLAFRFMQTADANLVVAGAGDLVCPGAAAASSATFSTAGQKIGSHVLVECAYTAANTLKWLVTNLGGTTMTVA